jgi:hypothetical protein
VGIEWHRLEHRFILGPLATGDGLDPTVTHPWLFADLSPQNALYRRRLYLEHGVTGAEHEKHIRMIFAEGCYGRSGSRVHTHRQGRWLQISSTHKIRSYNVQLKQSPPTPPLSSRPNLPGSACLPCRGLSIRASPRYRRSYFSLRFPSMST